MARNACGITPRAAALPAPLPTTLPSQSIAVTGTGYTGQATWVKTSGGSWNDFAHWDETGGKPGIDGALSVNDQATFGAAIGSSAATVSLNGVSPVLTALTFNHSGASYTIAAGSGGSITLGTGSASATVTNSAGSHTVSAPLVLANATAVATANGSALTLSGEISGSGGLTKTGGGLLTLSGTNSFAGATVVSEGTLAVNGSLAGPTLSVASGATLTGVGTIAGSTTIAGTHAPGNSPGVQSFTNLTYSAGSSLAWQLVGNTGAGRGSNFDGVNVSGNLTFAGNTTVTLDFSSVGSQVSWSDPFWNSNQSWTVYSVGGTTTGLGQLNLAVASWNDKDGQALASVRPSASFSIGAGLGADSNNVVLNYSLTAVPEPSTYALLGGLSALGLALYRRRRAGAQPRTPAAAGDEPV